MRRASSAGLLRIAALGLLGLLVLRYDKARADTRFELLKLTYRSDDLPVVAFVYRPKAAGDKRPVVVYNRGSYVRQGAARELLVPLHRLADAGFVVVAPMYRGSEGAPGRDEMGGADVADLMNVRAVIASLPYADAANVFLFGESRGGMMVLQALRDGFEARAAATVGTFTDLDAYLKEDPRAAAASAQIFPDFEANRACALVESAAAVRWPDRISAPLLIMHGGSDTTVSPSHSLQIAAALQRAGKPDPELFDRGGSPARHGPVRGGARRTSHPVVPAAPARDGRCPIDAVLRHADVPRGDVAPE